MKSKHIIAAVVVIAIVCVVGVLFFITAAPNEDGGNNNGSTGGESGLSSIYTYTAEGYNTAGTETYGGTWVIHFKNGRVTNSEWKVSTVAVPETSQGQEKLKLIREKINSYNIDTNKQPYSPSSEKDVAKSNNKMINGDFYGYQTIGTNYGVKDLREYKITVNGNEMWCYSDDSGVIYLLIELTSAQKRIFTLNK